MILQFKTQMIDCIVDSNHYLFGAEFANFYRKNVFSMYGYLMPKTQASYPRSLSLNFNEAELNEIIEGDPFKHSRKELRDGNFYEKPLIKFKEVFNIKTISKYIFDNTRKPNEDRDDTNSKSLTLADVGYVLKIKYKNETIPESLLNYDEEGKGLSETGAYQVAIIVLNNKGLIVSSD